jgi:hypothetical protein
MVMACFSAEAAPNPANTATMVAKQPDFFTFRPPVWVAEKPLDFPLFLLGLLTECVQVVTEIAAI